MEHPNYPAMTAITPDIEQNHTRADILTAADIERICNEHGIQSDVVHGAHKLRRGDSGNVDRESIFTMALAHRKMAILLVSLGFQKCIYENYTHAKGERTIEINGKHISINSMLSAFSWKPDSFKNKSISYKWAHNTAVSKQWKGAQGIPTGTYVTCQKRGLNTHFAYFLVIDDDPAFNDYKLWCVMEYLWAPGGAMEMGSLHGNNQGVSPAVIDWAMQVKQTRITQAKNSTVFHSYLEDR